MPIEYSLLRSLTARQIMSALIQDGFYLRGQRGSHQYYHSDVRKVTVSFHKSSDTFPAKTLKSIIESQARWSEDDVRRLTLLKQ
jgi:predicted RNA binding protein YcfA (HicA-like mRNA interferase family)